MSRIRILNDAAAGTESKVFVKRTSFSSPLFIYPIFHDSANTPPTLTLTGDDVSLYEGQEYVEPGYSATHAVDGDITDKVTVDGPLNTEIPGEYTLTYTVIDSRGGKAQETRKVTVQENTGPVITLVGSTVKVVVGDDYVEPGYSATDVQDGDLTDKVKVTGYLDTNTIGQYVLTYKVMNSRRKWTETYRTINVDVNEPPVITLLGPTTINVLEGEIYTEPGYTATDAEDGDLTDDVDVAIADFNETTGEYTLIYTVTDSHGGTDTKQRIITVIANTAPVITLVDGDMTIEQGEEFIEPGYTATDSEDGDLTDDVVVTGSVDVDTVGEYTLTYTVTDSGGLSDTKQRIVTVEEPEEP